MLSIVAVRGSGAAGHQYAFLQFSNTSSTGCTLSGFPGVQLEKAGTAVGKPAVRLGTASTVRLTSGMTVTAPLIVDSSCNAVTSDSVQVIPPNRTDKVVLPLALRACPFTIGPFAAQ